MTEQRSLAGAADRIRNVQGGVSRRVAPRRSPIGPAILYLCTGAEETECLLGNCIEVHRGTIHNLEEALILGAPKAFGTFTAMNVRETFRAEWRPAGRPLPAFHFRKTVYNIKGQFYKVKGRAGTGIAPMTSAPTRKGNISKGLRGVYLKNGSSLDQKMAQGQKLELTVLFVPNSLH